MFSFLLYFSSCSNDYCFSEPGFYSGNLTDSSTIFFNLSSTHELKSFVFLSGISQVKLTFYTKNYNQIDLNSNGTNLISFAVSGREPINYNLTEFQLASGSSEIYFSIWIIPQSQCSTSIMLASSKKIYYDYYSPNKLTAPSSCIFYPNGDDGITGLNWYFNHQKAILNITSKNSTTSYHDSFRSNISGPFYLSLTPKGRFRTYYFSLSTIQTSNHFPGCESQEICTYDLTLSKFNCPSIGSSYIGIPYTKSAISCTPKKHIWKSLEWLWYLLISLIVATPFAIIFLHYYIRRELYKNSLNSNDMNELYSKTNANPKLIDSDETR